MTLEQMGFQLAKSALLYSNFTLTKEVVRAWFETLSEVSMEDFAKAMIAINRQPGRVFFPTPGEVTRELIALKNGTQFTPEEAWLVAVEVAKGAGRDPEKKKKIYRERNLASQAAFIRSLKAFYDRLLTATAPYNPRGSTVTTEAMEWLRREFIADYKVQLNSKEKESTRGNLALNSTEKQLVEMGTRNGKLQIPNLAD